MCVRVLRRGVGGGPLRMVGDTGELGRWVVQAHTVDRLGFGGRRPCFGVIDLRRRAKLSAGKLASVCVQRF